MNKKSNGVAKQMILLCTPFVLFAVAVCLLSVFVFNAFIASSPVYTALMNEQIEVYNDDVIDELFEPIEVETFVDENPDILIDDGDIVPTSFYDIDNFPVIRWGKKWATITIPYLGANEISVYEGDSDSMLDKGVAHSFFSYFPGQGNNCVLSFHVNRQKQLYYLQDLPVGELIEINTLYGKYVYKVTSVDIFNSDDKTLIARRGEEMLTIYTCYPNVGPYRKKRIAITGSIVYKLSDPTWR